MTDKNTVYKLIGPVLVKQDQAEAKANVAKRLEFITSEMCVPRYSLCALKYTIHCLLCVWVDQQAH